MSTATITPTPTPDTFAIFDDAFAATYKGDCISDVRIIEVIGRSFTLQGTIEVMNSQNLIWCYKVKHTWVGTWTYAGYTFTSDEADPLQFTIDPDKGYIHIGGAGTVTLPDGTVINLP
jgi:hypothetical protein